VKVKMEVATTLTLAEEGTVVGLKDSQNDLQWFRDVCLGARLRGIDLRGFLGTRSLIDASLIVGGVGSIPGIANVAARECVECHEAAARGDFETAARAQERVLAYERLASVARSGSPLAASFSSMKTYLQKRGIIAHNTVTSPLRSLSAEEAARLDEIMQSLPAAVTAG
jgi:4-hydroxy-tetrahydrodipicolinate synthase